MMLRSSMPSGLCSAFFGRRFTSTLRGASRRTFRTVRGGVRPSADRVGPLGGWRGSRGVGFVAHVFYGCDRLDVKHLREAVLKQHLQPAGAFGKGFGEGAGMTRSMKCPSMAERISVHSPYGTMRPSRTPPPPSASSR